ACAAENLEIGLRLGDEKNRVSEIRFNVPSAGTYAFIAEPVQLSTLKWVEFQILKASAKSPAKDLPALITIRELRLVPESRGFSLLNDVFELSPHVLFDQTNGASLVRIQNPFPQKAGSEAAQNRVLELRVEGDSQMVWLFWGTNEMRIRTRPGISEFTIPASFMERAPSEVSLRSPTSIRITKFRTGILQAGTTLPAVDPGILLYHVPLTDTSYVVARWDIDPEVLLFLFRDYAAQDRYLKRLAFFVEKIGFAGTLAADAQIADLHGWNAHDYKAEDLARFFDVAARSDFPLSREEIELRTLLVDTGIIVADGKGFRPLKGAIVAISQESPTYLRKRLLAHELSHALFFTCLLYTSP
ncbi:MAG: hypothetical protein N3A02_00375, partial [Rectinema sp.]|nr:hypothetical protein [Rectinema sp.]